LGAIKTMRIVEELMEIWLNEVCDRYLVTKISSCTGLYIYSSAYKFNDLLLGIVLVTEAIQSPWLW